MALSGLNREINFLGSRRVAAIVSAILLVVSIASLATRGLNFGIDFTGGVLLEAGYEGAADLPDIRQRLAAGGIQEGGARSLAGVVSRREAELWLTGAGYTIRES